MEVAQQKLDRKEGERGGNGEGKERVARTRTSRRRSSLNFELVQLCKLSLCLLGFELAVLSWAKHLFFSLFYFFS